MNKNCDNCYWKFYGSGKWCAYEKDRIKDNSCMNHAYKCEICNEEQREYKYEGKYYCSNCLMKKFEVEECTEISYYKNGEYLGSENDFDEVINNLDENIEII